MNSHAQPLFHSLLSIEVDLVTVPPGASSLTATGSEHPVEPGEIATRLAATYRQYVDRQLSHIEHEWTSWVATGEPAQLERYSPGHLGILARNGTVLGRFQPDTSAAEIQRVGRDAAMVETMSRALIAAGRLPDDGVANVLRRIRGNIDQLHAAEPAKRMTVARKALQLGTSTISAQTVVQVDGDVIQRLDASMLGTTALRDLHAGAVAGAVGYWQVLVAMFVHLGGGSIGLLGAVLPHRAGLRRWIKARGPTLPLSGPRHELLKPSTFTDAWTTMIASIKDLVTRGGVTIDTTVGDTAWARTIIQLDGDTLWFVADDIAGHPDVRDRHVRKVADWYAKNSSAAAVMQRYVSAAQSAVTALVAAAFTIYGISTGEWRRVVVGTVLSVVALPAVRWLILWEIRRRIGKAIAG